MAGTSTTPPPPKSNTGFIAAAIVMVLLMGGLIYWKTSSSKEPEKTPPPPPKPTAATAPTMEEQLAPPPIAEVAPSATAAAEPKKGVGGGGGGVAGCPAECTGTASGALQSAVRAKGGAARGCYERALRQNATLQGKMSVTVRVGTSGQACSVNVSNGLGDPGVGSCVAQMFRSGTYPAPQGGCVDIAVPLNFVPKT